LLAPYWPGDSFRQKNSGSGFGFSENPEKPISGQNNHKIFCKNLRIFMWKIAKMIALSDFKNPVTYYLLTRKGRATSKNVEGAQPLAAKG